VLTASYVTDNEREQLCCLSYVADDLVAPVGIVCWLEQRGRKMVSTWWSVPHPILGP